MPKLIGVYDESGRLFIKSADGSYCVGCWGIDLEPIPVSVESGISRDSVVIDIIRTRDQMADTLHRLDAEIWKARRSGIE